MIKFQLWAHRQWAMLAGLFNRTAKVEQIWTEILKLQQEAGLNTGAALGTLAHLAAANGKKDLAENYLRQSLSQDSSLSSSWFNLGFLLQERGAHEEAMPMFDRAIELDGKSDRAFYGKAISLIKLQRGEEAIPLLKKNIELQPLSPFGLYQLAHVYFRRGDRDLAEKAIRQVSRFEPQVSKQLERETGIILKPLV
jgi:tetratricopeptide (TPR) repeat protein